MNWESPSVRIKTGILLLIAASIVAVGDATPYMTANATLISTMFITGSGLLSVGIVKQHKAFKNEQD